MIESIEALCDDRIRFTEFKDVKEHIYAIKNWLKDLKYRVQPKQEWSKKDEEMLTWLCRIIHSQRILKVITLKEETELGKWMDKWLNHNPQSTWKPSGEQMHYLYWIANVKLGDSVVEQEVSKHLNELYQDLKKLMEK